MSSATGFMQTLPNLLGFQLVWCAAVGGAANGWSWAGPSALLLFAAWTLATSPTRRSDTLLMLGCGVVGFAIDSVWVQLGWIQFASPLPWADAAPLWIVAMWMGFGLTINHSLAALKAHPLWAALLGLLGGPFAYWIAARAWNAAVISDAVLPFVMLGVAWALITPALLWLADHLPGWPPATAARVA